MATNTQVNGYAKICQYLYQTDTLKKAAFNGGGLDNVHAKSLYLVRKAFDWGLDQSISTVSEINPSLYSLCGAKLQQGIAIYSGGSGGIVPSPSGSGSYQPYTLYHVVTAGEAGQTSISNTDWVGIQGFVNLIVNQNPPFELNTSFTFNSAQGLINLDLSGTSGNIYTLQEGDKLTAQGLYKIVTP